MKTLLSLLLLALSFVPQATAGRPDGPPKQSGYKVLAPISHGNLSIFPVVTGVRHDTGNLLTLDEGLRSGEVVVTEAGGVRGLMRGRRGRPVAESGPEVNTLVLLNNSSRPLLLLAGEIVTGGKQDRVVGKDRIVPPHSDPLDLSVFCVEPGRWTETKAAFGGYGAQMAQPSVRKRAMADKDQRKVWAEVGSARNAMAGAIATTPGARSEISNTSSYAKAMQTRAASETVDRVAQPIMVSYAGVIHQLREQNAVGVVVAVRGEIIWADIFASSALLEKYWPKLARSYAAESITTSGNGNGAGIDAARDFIDEHSGGREIVESEPGVFRSTEVTGSGFHLFELTSLLPGMGFDVHISKMAD